MTTTIQILMGVVFFIGAFILSQIIVGRRLRAIGARILKELSEQKALDGMMKPFLNPSRMHRLYSRGTNSG